jgi:phage shock protein PspC (stress-responsive transcriptional regulator)
MTEIPAGPDAGATQQPQAGAAPPPGPPPAPPPAGPPTGPPLVRPLDDRVFRGVCGAVGRATGTDPVLWRVLVVVLVLFGGTGLVLYLAGWLLIPEEGQPESDLQRLVRGGGGGSTGATLALALLALFAFLVLDDGRGLVPLAVVGLLAYLVLRNRSASDGRPPAGAAQAPVGAAAWDAPPAWSGPAGPLGPPPPWGPPPGPVGYVPPPAPAPRAPRSMLGPLTVSAVVVAVGLLLLAASLGVDGITAPRVLATALLVTGAGLLVGTVWGRSRGLIALAVVLTLALSATSSFDRRFSTTTGDRTWVVTGSTERALGAGSATLDLRGLAGTDRRDLTVEARVGAGELLVLVPEDLRVELESRVGLGQILLDQPGRGRYAEAGAGLAHDVTLGPPGGAAVVLDVRVGLGELEVHRVEAQ